MSLVAIAEADYVTVPLEADEDVDNLTPDERARFIGELEERMREAARKFEFEKAAQLRDRVKGAETAGGVTAHRGDAEERRARRKPPQISLVLCFSANSAPPRLRDEIYFFPYSMCSRSVATHTGPRSRL